MHGRAGHPDPVIPPVDLQGATRTIQPHGPVRQPTSGGGDGDSAGGGARSERDPHTPLPDPHFQMAARQHLHDLHIGPLREQRVVFVQRPELRQINRIDIGHEKRAGTVHFKCAVQKMLFS